MRKFFISSLFVLFTLVIKSQVPDKLLLAQLKAESNTKHFNSDGLIKSSKGALGIAQFMPATWKWLIDTSRIPSNYSIENKQHQIAAQKIFMYYLYKFDYECNDDPIILACAAYNAGPYKVRRLVRDYGKNWRAKLPQETITYLHKLNL